MTGVDASIPLNFKIPFTSTPSMNAPDVCMTGQATLQRQMRGLTGQRGQNRENGRNSVNKLNTSYRFVGLVCLVQTFNSFCFAWLRNIQQFCAFGAISALSPT
jgi:hypothetical protein